MAHDIVGLEKKIRALDEVLSKLQSRKHAELLLPIIHRPGWTTVAEFELVNNHVNSLHDQITTLHKAMEALVAVAEKIGKTS